MKTRYDFSYKYRLAHPDSEESRLCHRLLNNLTNQTMLVEDALANGFFSFDDIHNLNEKPSNPHLEDVVEPQVIYQWAYFCACDIDRRKFDDAGIPYIHTNCCTWVGITSFGTAWEVYVVAELADALYN